MITDMRVGRNKTSNLDAKFPGVYDGNHKHADFSKFTHLYLGSQALGNGLLSKNVYSRLIV